MQKNARLQQGTDNRGSPVDVIVVGAGVTGLSTAWRLLKQGSRVTVVERSGIAAGASGVQPGGVRQQWSTAPNCDLAREATAFYRDLPAHLDVAGRPVLEQCGYLFVADSPDELERLAGNVALQNELGIPSRILSPAEAGAIVSGLRTDGLAGAAWCAEDGYFDKPQSVVEGFAAGVIAEGGQIVIGTVERIEHSSPGWRVVLADGRELAGDQVVVAAAHETRGLLEPLEVQLPIEAETRYLFLSEQIRERLLEPLVVAVERRFAAKQLANGRVLTSDLGAEGDPDTEQPRWRQTIEAGVRSLVPILEYVTYPVLVDGVYDVTPDNQPILDSVSAYPGLWVAAGFSGHGFMFAPATGRLICEAVLGRRDPVLDHFSLARFSRNEIVRETQVV